MPCIFLTRQHLNNLANWKYSVKDNSVSTKWFNNYWEKLVEYIPNTVAPNVLSLVGLLCIAYAYNLSYNYAASYPVMISLACFGLIAAYVNLDAIDGKHARRTGNSSPMGELFDHSCDNISVVFLTLIFCHLFGIDNSLIKWYMVQGAQLVFLESHVQAYIKRVVEFGKYNGPVEFLMIYLALILFNMVFGTAIFQLPISIFAGIFGASNTTFCITVLKLTYCMICAYIVFVISKISSYSTRNGLIISIGVRLIPFIFAPSAISEYTIFANGLVMSVLTGDIILAKMAGRELNQLIPVLMMVSLFDNFLCIMACVTYYVIIFYEISVGLGLPILTPRVNVYCNGVFDMFHVGHMNMLKYAAGHGTNLIAGIHSDESVEKYKRRPIMTSQERYAVVRASGLVDRIVEDADLYITEEFIKTNNIQIVVCSPEYDKPDDAYYAVPRRMGILRIAPRTAGISTSDLIRRIKDRADTESKQTF